MTNSQAQASIKQSHFVLRYGRVFVRWCLLLLLLTAGALTVYTVLSPQAFKVQRVKVYATFAHINPNRIEQQIAPFLGQGFFWVPMRQLQKNVEQLPWVKQVHIRRLWPPGLSVRIQERQAIAIWQQHALLSTEGVIFRPNVSGFAAHLPHFYGPNAQAPELLRWYERMQKNLRSWHVQVQSLRLTPRRSWQVLLSNGVQIYLGRLHLHSRWRRFLAVYPQLLAHDAIGKKTVLDFRYPNGFTLSNQPSS